MTTMIILFIIRAMLMCIWSKCSRPATYPAYSTVGCGDAHSCETHAPAWLKAGSYTTFYSPVPCKKDTALALATVKALAR